MTKEQIEARANVLQEALVDIIDLIVDNKDNLLTVGQEITLNNQINEMLYEKYGILLLRKPLSNKEQKQ